MSEPTVNPLLHHAERSAAGYDLTPPSPAELEALVADLDDEERRVLLDHGTEPPFCGGLLHAEDEGGVYVCRLCGLPLFRPTAKFESGTGWPSFTEPFDPNHVRHLRDDSHGMVRTEIRCRRCDGHLGHVFNDGPGPAGTRYCMNSVSLELVPEGEELPRKVAADRQREAS